MLAYLPLSAKDGHEDKHGHTSDAHAHDSHAKEEFNAGEFVIDHVSDMYDWHIASFGEKHISIPLPIILYSKNPELHEGKAFHVFMSNKFHHGHSSYKGFEISHGSKYKGKIVELDSHGHEIGRPIDVSITKTIAGAIFSVFIIFWFG